jgi:hypothetical protein
MLDMVGVTQHHDAITGTSLQKVATEYKNRVFEATKKMMPVYGELIGQAALLQGMDAKWEPIGLFEGMGNSYELAIPEIKLGQKAVFAVHNPTDSTIKNVEIMLQNQNVELALLNPSSKEFEPVSADIRCEVSNAKQNMAHCFAQVLVNIPPQSIAFVKVTPATTTLNMMMEANQEA